MHNTDLVLLEQENWYGDVPRAIWKHVVFGIALIVFAVGGFSAWAFRAPLAAAVIAQGSFVATGRNKIVQHLEGGIIDTIHVAEGDHIDADQVLLSLDETAAEANARELFIRQTRLEVTAARLISQYREETTFIPPVSVEAHRDDYEIASIIEGQELSFRVATNARQNDVGLLQRNIDTLTIRRDGYEVQLESLRQQLDLLEREFADKSQLLEKQLIRRSDVSTVERTKIEAEGQIGRIEAEIAEVEQLRLKYEGQIEKLLQEHRQTALDNLQIIESELESIREKYRKATNVRERSDVRAPVSGTVVRLYYHTAGGVIETGKAIAEILPDDAPLIIETLVSRTDIDDVHEGQEAVVRLTSLNQRTTPVLNGEVIYISADAVEDATTGMAREVYVVRVNLPSDELARVPGFIPTPGMPAEIMIQTAERTFVQYLTKPIKDSMSRAFRER